MADIRSIKARLGYDTQTILINDVLYFKSEDKYITVKHTKGESIISMTLKNLERQVGDNFVRVHRNALVSKERIRGYKRGKDQQWSIIIDSTNDTLAISRRHVSAIRELLKSDYIVYD